MKTIAALLVMASVGLMGLHLYAQPTIPRENIPPHIPADVRQQIERLYSSDPMERASAAFWLRKMGDKAIPSIPFLIAILPEITQSVCSVSGCEFAPFPGEEAARTLIALGEPAVEPLAAALKDENLGIRRMAASTLGNIKDPRAVEPLATALKDDDRNVRMMAAWALAEIGEPALEPLITALRDKKSRARGDAAWALAKIGDHRAVEPLIEALKEESPSLREDAAEALEKITGMGFGVNPDQWQIWWEKNKGKKPGEG
jgi:hypothetical protein